MMRVASVRGYRLLSFALWGVALASLLLRVFVAVLIDREGGVTAIGLKSRPSFVAQLESSTEAFRASGNSILLAGDENGVTGMEFIDWHARAGCWLIWGMSAVSAYIAGRHVGRRQ